MVRRKKKKKMNVMSLIENKKMTLLLAGFIIVIVLGASTGFSAFGPSSAWEADVELTSIHDGSDWISSFEDIRALGGFPSARIIKVDLDGNPLELHAQGETKTYIRDGFLEVGTITYPYFPSDAPGMQPTIDFSVGQMYLSNSTGDIITSYVGEWENVDNETGLLRFYFAFSVAFTTRATMLSIPIDDPRRTSGFVFELESYDKDMLAVHESFPEIGAANLMSRVDIRVGNNLNYTYKGMVEGVNLIDTRARYTFLAENMDVSDVSIDTFNSEYDWKGMFETGIAEPGNADNPITLLTDEIDTETEHKVSFICNAFLKPGIDANKIDRFAGEVYQVSGIGLYNVELIYDLVCEVTLNGIPLTAKGDLLSGRTDYVFFPPEDPEPFDWMDYWWVILIVALVLFGGGASRRRR